jgi:hypothetical protein
VEGRWSPAAAAAAVALAIWAVVRLLGVDLTVRIGQDSSAVGAVDVLVTTVLAGLAAWGVHRVLARRLGPPGGGRSSAAPPSPSR